MVSYLGFIHAFIHTFCFILLVVGFCGFILWFHTWFRTLVAYPLFIRLNVSYLKNERSHFELELVAGSHFSIDMLAAIVNRRGDRLATSPQAKPLRAPPSEDSAHPRHIHLAWPRSTLLCFRRLCTTEVDFKTLAEQFVRRFTLHFGPEP